MQRPTAIAVLAFGLSAAAGVAARGDERQDFFEAKIRPVLADRCARCHGALKASGGLRVDSRGALLAGGDSGPAIAPGEPEASLLIRAVERQDEVAAMPPEQEQALRPDQIADFASWIRTGAVWPANAAPLKAAEHWAFASIREPLAPAVADRAWGRTGVDGFVLARQEAAGLQPAPAADKRTLIRRATFDLTGLPPTPREVEAFLHDSSPRAFEAVVDRLLQSPAYGERWGRHWLDVVRYADTAGETADYPAPEAWRYRNYVIEAFNADKPYHEFLREQIAGDVFALEGPPERYAERVTATGFLAISRRFGFDSENYHHLTIQDTIDTLGQSVLGLSLGCARCHDHKFDPVTMRDYYALYGIFDSTRYPFPGSEQKPRVRSLAPLLPPAESQARWRACRARLSALAAELARHKLPVPGAVLRSLHDIDGDFELQAPAAGGSNGVLVPPWRARGGVAVTTAAQSPFQNLYAGGRVGASVPEAAGAYRIEQAIHPRHVAVDGGRLFVNLDFRVGSAEAADAEAGHRFSLGALGAPPAIEVLISGEAIFIQAGTTKSSLGRSPSSQWQNLQFAVDMRGGIVSGAVGEPGATREFSIRAAPSPERASDSWALGPFEVVAFESLGPEGQRRAAIEFDNLGIQEAPLAPVSLTASLAAPLHAPSAGPDTAVEGSPDAGDWDPAKLSEELSALTGIDGDLELQTAGAAPVSPWNPGPNSVAQLSPAAQSPFRNLFPLGRLGLHLPNRGEYDGFGVTLGDVQPDAAGRLSASFDFRCAERSAGGAGAWRYYLGHGPGQSAAVELYFNGDEFFRRSGDARESVGRLAVGEWHQVQLTMDLKARSYSGVLASREGRTEFQGRLATGWDGAIDYAFIDSYGHLSGVRPSLDADNFVVGAMELAPLDGPPRQALEAAAARRERVAEIRRRLAAAETAAEQGRAELNRLLAEGPCAMAYGMSEGTPHNAAIQLRGEPSQPGPEVPRGFPAALGGERLPSETVGSGRRELALWLTQPEHPLTARVIANRVWQRHFGRGIVKTPNDFGVRGLPPTHPELLDYLATQLIRSGWSVKSLHRLIMLSATYQQATEGAASTAPGASAANSAELYSAFPRRRLSAEEIRDAILAVSGELNRTAAREHPFPSPIEWGYSQHGPFNAVYDHNRRSVYLMTQRLKRHPFLALFDGADPNTTTAERLTTTVPTQALFFLNDPFVHAKSERWAARLLAAESEEAARIERAWRSACGRPPTEEERADAAEFLKAYRGELGTLGAVDVELSSWAAYLRVVIGSNEFLYVD